MKIHINWIIRCDSADPAERTRFKLVRKRLRRMTPQEQITMVIDAVEREGGVGRPLGFRLEK